jgi:hypothetical protein
VGVYISEAGGIYIYIYMPARELERANRGEFVGKRKYTVKNAVFWDVTPRGT